MYLNLLEKFVFLNIISYNINSQYGDKMEPNIKDLRRVKREKSFIIARIYDQKCYVTDVSEQGCQIFIEKQFFPPEKDKNIDIYMEINEKDKTGNNEMILVSGEIMWQKEVEDFVFLGVSFKPEYANHQAIRKVVLYWNFLNTTFGTDKT